MIHQAGPMENLVQRCSRCGVVLTDYRNAMIADDDPYPLSGWAEGASVDVSGTFPVQLIVVDVAPDCEVGATA